MHNRASATLFHKHINLSSSGLVLKKKAFINHSSRKVKENSKVPIDYVSQIQKTVA